ncbi:MAG: hypothetical protein JOY67_15610 [Hyphomicrobiales bacterium]|nr:hypothetical protein [Hyphomicrobiales bacterium]MBV9114240.1 hypothetical protein [Hyphomicrobiales bacterium]MBV9519410.1 hypothetical protein [Hyphomicrobiales bacterium]
MIASILAMVLVVAAGLAYSAWSLRTRGRRLHGAHQLGMKPDAPSLISDFETDPGNRKA